MVEKRNDSPGACDRLRAIFLDEKRSRFEERLYQNQTAVTGATGKPVQISLPLAEALASLEQA